MASAMSVRLTIAASGVFAEGGGIRSVGSLTINNSTISGNTVSTPRGRDVTLALGGGIWGGGTFEIAA